MSKLIPLLTLITATLSAQAFSQPSFTTFGGGPDGIDARESTWIAYFNRSSGRFTGGFSINYNKVQWREEYSDELETILRGKKWRLGKHFWSTLDTNLDLSLGGVRVEAGYYYLGLARSDDGAEWSLLLIDAMLARKQHLDAFNIDDAAVAFVVPLRFTHSDEKKSELQLFFAVDRGEGGIAEGFVEEVEFRLLFGPYRLSAEVIVDPATPDKADLR